MDACATVGQYLESNLSFFSIFPIAYTPKRDFFFRYNVYTSSRASSSFASRIVMFVFFLFVSTGVFTITNVLISKRL